MKVLLAGLFHETHCFVPDRTTLSDFSVSRGDGLLEFRGNGSMIDGFLEVAEREAWDVVPSASYIATPSGIVDDQVVDAFLSDLDAVALTQECDAVFLALHGAMVSESDGDVEGTLLSHLRAMPSLAHAPIVGVFDLHATMTPTMAAQADALICYRENPHVDARHSAMRAAGLLARVRTEGRRPRMHHRRARIVWPPTGTGTADSPMRDLEALARRIEEEDPEIWAVNVVAGFLVRRRARRRRFLQSCDHRPCRGSRGSARAPHRRRDGTAGRRAADGNEPGLRQLPKPPQTGGPVRRFWSSRRTISAAGRPVTEPSC